VYEFGQFCLVIVRFDRCAVKENDGNAVSEMKKSKMEQVLLTRVGERRGGFTFHRVGKIMGMDRVIEKKKRGWPFIIGVVISLFSIVALVLVLLGHGRTLKLDLDRVTISVVRKGEFQEFIPILGRVMPINTIYLDAVEGGRVEAVYIESGAMVEQGAPILKLSNTDLLMNIMYREAELFQQSNNLRNTRLMFEQNTLQLDKDVQEVSYQLLVLEKKLRRNKVLFEKQLISLEEYEALEDEYSFLVKQKEITQTTRDRDLAFREQQIAQLEKSLQRMQENLDVVKLKLENLIIRAPVTGHLTSLNVEIGELKQAGERLGQLDVLDGFKVRAEIDEHYISRIENGGTGLLDISGESYTVSVQKIYDEVTNGRFNVDLEFGGKTPTGIRRGQTLHIRLELGDLTDANMISTGGFFQSTGGQWVFVLNDSDRYAEKRMVKLGRSNPRAYEILDGLKEGERVVTSSYDNFVEMDRLVFE